MLSSTASKTASARRLGATLLLVSGVFFSSISHVAAQTFTSCSPLNATCPSDPALGINHAWNFTNATFDSDTWDLSQGATVNYAHDVASFQMSAKGEAPTAKSQFYIFYGSVSIVMTAAKGQGIVSSVTLQSDDLDEIDLEWIGGNNTHVQLNYFGKGNTTTYDRAIWVPVHDPQGTFHNYTINWTADKLQWLIDDQMVRELPYEKADGNGTFYPQTPVDVRIGAWAGGDSPQPGTVEWAGGAVNWDEAPFFMDVRSVTVNDGTPNASSYSYGDRTGSSKSIQVDKGVSSIAQKILAGPAPTVNQRFNALSTGAKVGIAVAIGVVILGMLAGWIWCCLRARRAGRRERAREDADWAARNAELLAYRRTMAGGGFAQGGGGGGAGDGHQGLLTTNHYGFSPPRPTAQRSPLLDNKF